MNQQFMIQCIDRRGMQHSSTFDVPESAGNSILRYGWEEAKRLCGDVRAVSTAYISTIDGRIVGTLR